MTVEEFLQTLLFIFCLLAGSVILPVGMVVSAMPKSDVTGGTPPQQVVIFEMSP